VIKQETRVETLIKIQEKLIFVFPLNQIVACLRLRAPGQCPGVPRVEETLVTVVRKVLSYRHVPSHVRMKIISDPSIESLLPLLIVIVKMFSCIFKFDAFTLYCL